MQRPGHPVSVWFRLTALAAAAFAITILGMLAAVFTDSPDAPAARCLNRHGGTLIAVEAALTLTFGFWAMAFDRRQTLREMRDREPTSDADTESHPSPDAQSANISGPGDSEST